MFCTLLGLFRMEQGLVLIHLKPAVDEVEVASVRIGESLLEEMRRVLQACSDSGTTSSRSGGRFARWASQQSLGGPDERPIRFRLTGQKIEILLAASCGHGRT